MARKIGELMGNESRGSNKETVSEDLQNLGKYLVSQSKQSGSKLLEAKVIHKTEYGFFVTEYMSENKSRSKILLARIIGSLIVILIFVLAILFESFLQSTIFNSLKSITVLWVVSNIAYSVYNYVSKK